METFSMLLALCEGNPPVTCGFPSQRPVMWSFDVFFDLCLNKRLSKQSRCRRFEMPSRSLWCHCNDMDLDMIWLHDTGAFLICTRPTYDCYWGLMLHRYHVISGNNHAHTWGGGYTKPIFSVLLFSRFFRIIKTHVTYMISLSYLTGVAAAELRRHLANMNVI